ncbi:MAG: hypothetical protein ACXW35_11155 [Nitrospira sp.]
MSSLATLMGIPPEDEAEFFNLSQELFWDMMQRQRASDGAIDGEGVPRAMLIALQEGMRIHSIRSKAPSNR